MTFIAADLNTVSGSVRASQLSCRQLDVRTVSGDAGLQHCTAETLKLTSVTGELRVSLEQPFQTLGATTVTGALTVQAPVSGVHVQRRAVAGRVQLWQAAQRDDGPVITMNTVSGDL